MILAALNQYYERKEVASGLLAPFGWEHKELPFLIVLDNDGIPIAVEDTREEQGKQKRGKIFLVPQSIKRASGINANLLWDNPEYVLGLPKDGREERAEKCHQDFIRKIKQLNLDAYPPIASVLAFLENPNKLVLLEQFSPTWQEIKESGPFLSLRLALADEPIFRDSKVMALIEDQSKSAGEQADRGVCLITGKTEEMARLHASIKGVVGANTTGASIVSFNISATESYRKKQGANAPVGVTAAFNYTTALNNLLAKDSRQKILVGDTTAVFWAGATTKFEEQFKGFFEEPPKDDPDKYTRTVAELYRMAETGVFATDKEQVMFYILGLAPNAARLAVRFWHTGSVAELAHNFRQYFDELEVVHGPREMLRLPFWRLMASLALQGKSSNLSPKLSGDVMRAVLTGLSYPHLLLQAAIIRNRAERNVSYPRAALIKAYFNRLVASKNTNTERRLTVALNLEEKNIGYRLGRLFAALENIQERANPGINATIRDRFYGAASGTPVTVFANLMRLKNHHLAKLESPGQRIYYEKLVGEIMEAIDGFPPHLPLEEQGKFAVGYYHQKQAFYTKKTNQE